MPKLKKSHFRDKLILISINKNGGAAWQLVTKSYSIY